MSDYISKSEAIDSIVQNVVITTEEGLDLRNEIVDLIKNQPTVDEKEIIRKVFERVLERLEEKKRSNDTESDREWGKYIGYVDSIKIVKEEFGISE